MDAMKSTIAAVVWLMANAACAQSANLDGLEAVSAADETAGHSGGGNNNLSLLHADLPEGRGHGDAAPRERASMDSPYSVYLKSYSLASIGPLSAVAGFQPFQTSAASATFIRQHTGIDTRTLMSADRWLAQNSGLAQTFAVGHAWRDLTFEGAAFSGTDETPASRPREIRRIDSRSARLSFSLANNWVVRLSRGSVSGLDHLVAGEEVRRTAVSATYRQALAQGDWETTLAWGRNSRKFRESTVGYLVESAYRFQGVHAVFGRIEQVGSDEIMRENESLQRQLFMMNKLTVGYSQDLRLTARIRVDAGAFATRYFVPSDMAPSYGSGPTAYMMFVRVKLQ